MNKDEKEQVVAELAERLRTSDTLIVADYRGLTMPQIDALRGELLKHGARFQVVKNTLTRRAAEVAGTDALLAMLEGPTAIAFIEAEGDPAAVAKALAAAAKRDAGARDPRRRHAGPPDPRRGDRGAREAAAAGRAPRPGARRGHGAADAIIGLVNAPLQNLIGLIDARIEQLGGEGAAPEAEADGRGGAGPVEAEPAAEADAGGSRARDRDRGARAEAEAEPEAPAEEPNRTEQEDDDGGS